MEPALKAHPNATFLLHGHQMMSYGHEKQALGPTLPRLLDEYDNLYWTADITTLLAGVLLRFRSVSAFVDWYDTSAEPHIRNGQAVLSKLLKVAPNKVMWGTDIARPWNTKNKAFSRVMDATERMLEAVPEKHRAAYKRENALALFGL